MPGRLTSTAKGHSLVRPVWVMSSAACATALAVGLATPTPVWAAPASAPPPPELVALIQKMSELQVSSQRFSGEVTIRAKKLPRKLKALAGLRLKLTGEESTSPPGAAVTATILGKSLSLRAVGNTLYVRDPSIAEHDGGRPWIDEGRVGSGKLFGPAPTLDDGSGPRESGSRASGSHFKDMIDLLKAAGHVRSLGTSTVDGQSVVGFAGTIDPHKLEQSQLPAKLRASLRKLHLSQTGKIEAFIAANGVPVHTRLVLGLGGVQVKVDADVLAINFPVAAIPPPPAAETITVAELRKLEQKARENK